MIAAISALTILGILGVVAYFIMPKAEAPPPQLAQTYFVNTLSQSDFESEVGMEWAPFGPLDVQAKQGLRPLLTDLTSDFQGGGVFYDKTLAADAAFAIEAAIVLPRASDDVAVEVFVSDDPNFTGSSATSARELAFLARNGSASVILPGGRVEGSPTKLPVSRTPINVRVTISGDEASVEMNAKKLWAGKHNLDATKHRLAGVRFLAREGKDNAAPVVQSVRILAPQKQ